MGKYTHLDSENWICACIRHSSCCSYLYAAGTTDAMCTTRGDGTSVWREVCHDAEFSGYCVLAVCESQPSLVAIGNLKGTIKLLSISDGG